MEEKNFKSLDDIVFEHRNKNYGAYWLRNVEKKYLLRAVLIGVSLFAILILILFYFNLRDANRKKGGEKEVTIQLEEIKQPDEEIHEIEKKEEEPKIEEPKEERAQVKHILPTPEKDLPKEKEETVKNVEEIENKVVGKKDQEGSDTKAQQGGGDKEGKGDIDKPQPAKKEEDPNKIHAEVQAEYPGGIQALRKFLASRMEYPEEATEKGIQGKVILKFVVEKDGSVSDIRIVKDIGGGCGKEAVRVLKLTKKWVPAQIDGKPVRSYFSLPVSFQLTGM